jgi:aspartyl-tRNA synthetase
VVVAAFPDYRWELRHLLVDAPWLAAHFTDTGTHRGSFLGVPASGRSVSTQEFAFYRVDAGRIVEVWVTADDLHLLQQLRPPAEAPTGS